MPSAKATPEANGLAVPDGTWTIELDRGHLVLALMALLDLAYASTLVLPGNWVQVPVRNCVLFTLGGFMALQAAVFLEHRRRGTLPGIVGHVRKVHFLQILFQLTIMVYWGLYWHPVHDNYSLMLVQLGFAYLFDSTLSWAMRRSFQLGFAQLPIIGSLNLFVWFVPDYFFAQLLLVAAALAGKALITWKREGRVVHVFNPAALASALASVILLALAPTDIAGGIDLPAAQEIPPHIYEVLFLVSMAVNIWFPTVLITLSVFFTTISLHYLSMLVLGKPAYLLPINAPLMIGAILLVTDPATSPRTRPGRVLFGVAYASLAYMIPAVLYSMDLPSGSEKVLSVPVVNLLASWFDRAGLRVSAAFSGIPGKARQVLESHAFHLAAWAACFAAFAPVLKTTVDCIFMPPKWVRYSLEVVQASDDEARLCQEQPEVCKPFALIGELFYVLGRDRPASRKQ